jgi:hypothetical protein
MVLQTLEYQGNMLGVFLVGLAVNQDVTEENKNELAQEVLESIIHGTQEYSWSPCQYKCHYCNSNCP